MVRVMRRTRRMNQFGRPQIRRFEDINQEGFHRMPWEPDIWDFLDNDPVDAGYSPEDQGTKSNA